MRKKNWVFILALKNLMTNRTQNLLICLSLACMGTVMIVSVNIAQGLLKSFKFYQDFIYISQIADKLSSFIFIMVPIIVCGMLFVHDCFQSAIIKSMHQYGLMKVVGATKKQINLIITIQGLLLYLIGVALSYMLSVPITSMVMPLYLKTVCPDSVQVDLSWSLSAFVITSVFLALLIIFSTQMVQHYVNERSVIDTIRYNIGSQNIKLRMSMNRMADIPVLMKTSISGWYIWKSFAGTKGFFKSDEEQMQIQNDLRRKSYLKVISDLGLNKHQNIVLKIAMHNVMKSAKVNWHVMITLVVALNILLLVIVMAEGTNPKGFAEEKLGKYDFSLTNNTFKLNYVNPHNRPLVDIDPFHPSNPFPISFLDELEKQNGARNISILKMNWAYVKSPDNKSYFNAVLIGVTDGYFEEFNDYCDGISKEDFMAGKIGVIVEPDWFEYLEKGAVEGYIPRVGNNKDFIHFEGKEDFQFAIEKSVPPDFNELSRDISSIILYVHESVLTEHNNSQIIYRVSFNSESAAYDQMHTFIRKTIGNPHEIRTEDKKQLIAQMQDVKVAFYTLGYLFIAVIGIIGFMGVVNGAIIQMDMRRREIAILKSIGMTNLQLRKILILEGIFYSAVLIFITYITTNFLVFKAYKMLKESYQTFIYPYMPFALASLIISLLMIAIPLVIYLPEKRASISEMLQDRTE